MKDFIGIMILTVAALLVAGAAAAEDTPVEALDRVWEAARTGIYDEARAEKYFTAEAYERLLDQVEPLDRLTALTPVLNEFLTTLGVSHTRFYDAATIDYYMFKSLFSTRELESPRVRHIGAQFVQMDGKYVVRQILDGYPAEAAGLRRGDRILLANGRDFHPYHAFNPVGLSDEVTLSVESGTASRQVRIRAVDECPHFSFYQAMLNSKRVIDTGAHRIGYVHLWTGTNKRILRDFTKIIEADFADLDAVIVDLRGGFGGAWYEYIDPFFADRSDFFEYTWINREGERELHQAEPSTNPRHFGGPLAVLINEGTRSGKEALTYQFRRNGRATVIGTTTWGAFTAGRGVFADEDVPYLLYLAIGELLLDGHPVEGVGVAPDIEVPFPLDGSATGDPQLERALKELSRQLGG